MTISESFAQARKRSVPILAVRTADQFSTVAVLARPLPDDKPFPAVTWDAARGLVGENKEGADAVVLALANAGKALARAAGQRAENAPPVQQGSTCAFGEAMIVAGHLPERSTVFAFNAWRQLVSQEPGSTAAAVQAVSNLRDVYKKNFRCLVLLGTSVPHVAELDQDIVIFDHALPDEAKLREMIVDLTNSAVRSSKTFVRPTADEMARAVDAVSGLSEFAAEQVTALSLDANGLRVDNMWERKRVAIEQQPGLSVWRGGDRFDGLVGLSSIKAHLSNQQRGRRPIGVVVWMDEIDKVMANVEQDTSGVRMDQLRTLLTEMDTNEWTGLVGIGVSGGGKSAIAKAFGNEAGVPTIALDLAGMESKYVGESEGNLRRSMQVIKAIGRGHAYFIATSNGASVMRPEMQRRFTDGFWFFDLLTADERDAALAFYVRKYELTKKQLADLPDFDGWTGAEIRNACRYAWNVSCTLREASRFVVPMARSRAEAIEELRTKANNRMLDASRPGLYTYDGTRQAKDQQQRRALELPPIAVVDVSAINKAMN